MTKSIMRPIASVATHMNPGFLKHWAVGGSRTLLLAECGHKQHRKMSQGLPARGKVRCKECEDIRDGPTRREKKGDGPWVAISWDAQTGLPVRTELKGCAQCGAPTACGKVFCEDHCYEMPGEV